jgi:protein HIRA/HIR1
MFQDAHAAFANGNRFNDVNGNRFNDGEVGETSRAGTKRKASLLDGDSPRAPKGRMMASTQPRQVGEVREIRAPRGAIASGSGISGAGKTLPVPSIQTILRVKPRGVDSTIYLEAQNAEDLKGKNKITYCANGQDQWLHYLPSAVLAMAMSTAFCAVACVDGSVFAYTPAGRL